MQGHKVSKEDKKMDNLIIALLKSNLVNGVEAHNNMTSLTKNLGVNYKKVYMRIQCLHARKIVRIENGTIVLKKK